MPSTLTGVASALSARTAPTASVPAGSDAPNAASVATPFQNLLDKMASILSHGGLLDVAGTWSALQTFSAGISAPVSSFTYPSLQSPWTTPSGKRKLGYWIDPFGAVHIEGDIDYGSNVTLASVGIWAAAALPSAARPLNYPTIPIALSGPTTIGIGVIFPGTGGDLQMGAPSGLTWRTASISAIYHPGIALAP